MPWEVLAHSWLVEGVIRSAEVVVVQEAPKADLMHVIARGEAERPPDEAPQPLPECEIPPVTGSPAAGAIVALHVHGTAAACRPIAMPVPFPWRILMPRSIDISVPPEKADTILQRIENIEGVVSLARQRGAALQPAGDILSIQTTNDATRQVLEVMDEVEVLGGKTLGRHAIQQSAAPGRINDSHVARTRCKTDGYAASPTA